MFPKYFLLIITLVTLSIGCSDDSSTDDKDFETVQGIQTLEHDGLTREYYLYIPDSYDASIGVPLMFNFHGFTGNAIDHLEYADMRPLAESEQFILVYPQGSLLQGLTHWNAALDGPDNKSDADDLGFIDVLLSKLDADYKIDRDRIYSCGYSNGAMFSYTLACQSGDLIAAVGSVSGAMLDIDCAPTHPIPVINLHGTSDFLLPYEGNSNFSSVESVINFWTNFNNTIETPVVNTLVDNGITIEHFLYDQGDNNVSVEHYKINEGGHVWFDINYEGRNTNELIWEFVSKYDVNGLR